MKKSQKITMAVNKPRYNTINKENIMKQFMDKDFLLSNETAKKLFEKASEMPIIDYHCHINPEEIANDRTFKNITEVWLGGDHYKWRQMRSNGVEEKYITGDASDYEKFEKWAETLQKLVGNPLYHWSHLELQRYFGFNKPLTGETARECWDVCNQKLADGTLSARKIILSSNVSVVCTTDDPADSLCWHQQIREDASFPVKVLPAWRPDKAMNIEKPEFKDYLHKLGEASGVNIRIFRDLKKALKKRMDFFQENGCCVADHGLEYVMYKPATDEEIDIIFLKRLSGKPLSLDEELKYKTAFMLFMGREYAARSWVMQLHYGALRNNNTRKFRELGPDTGFDSIGTFDCTQMMSGFLNALDLTGELPKTIIYSLNPNDNAAIGSLIGCFQGEGICGKIQHGSAWWFNDNKTGMQEQLTSLSNLGILSNFIGMLTDSRSFLSYTRHEYFRRILCDLIGTWVENGEYPDDMDFLIKMVQDISYNNAKEYFNF